MVINTRSFGRFWPVSWTITHRFGVPKRFPWLSNSKVRLHVGHQQSRFGPILARFLDYYSIMGSWSHSMIAEPLVRLRVGHQHSHIRRILVCFVHYHSAFWGPRAISTIDEPRGSFMCPSSTLTVLANSDPFRGLLLTVLGSRSDFHD